MTKKKHPALTKQRAKANSLDTFYVEPTKPALRRAAIRTVRKHAQDAEDEILLLEALGLAAS